LFLSPHTVKNHVSSILVKLQVENRLQAAVRAVRSGLV
jgi:DNA-binding NarL/FixJ family response regulator